MHGNIDMKLLKACQNVLKNYRTGRLNDRVITR